MKNRLVFINDGATWIREWIANNYPLAGSVLDFYHASGYLYDFADKAFVDSKLKDQWCTHQKEMLLQSEVETVIDNISGKEEAKKKIINYYRNNKGRMNYKEYRNIIGSGAIE